MELKYVEPAYTVAEKRSLFTKTLDGNRRLDIVARPQNPADGDMPMWINQAFGSVIWNETNLKENDLCAPLLVAAASESIDNEADRVVVLKLALDGLFAKVPNLKYDSRNPYICPVISERGEGYRRGYVVAWEESDALDVAAYMAGGRVDIYLDLLDFNGEYLGGEWLGDVDYSDLENDTDAYRRVVAGESFALAMETLEGIEAPEPQDPELPGEELLETFTKLS